MALCFYISWKTKSNYIFFVKNTAIQLTHNVTISFISFFLFDDYEFLQ